MSDYRCPNCGVEYEAIGNHEEDEGEQECETCGFNFLVSIDYDPIYYTECVEHDFEEFGSHNKVTGRLDVVCKICGKCIAKEIPAT